MGLGRKFDMIKKVVSTEKSARAAAENKYIIVVDNKSTKDEVKNAIETIFEVEVISINVKNKDGKTKRFKGIVGKQSDIKEAIVTLKKGQTINFAKLG